MGWEVKGPLVSVAVVLVGCACLKCFMKTYGFHLVRSMD